MAQYSVSRIKIHNNQNISRENPVPKSSIQILGVWYTVLIVI